MHDIEGMEIIVTGGAGFIGSNLVESLAQENKVYVIDNMHTGSELNLEEALKSGNVKLIKDDSKDIDRHGIDADIVFHLGMYSSSPMYKENPNLLNEVVEGIINVLEYARKNECMLVFASTSSIYNGIEPPQREDIVPKVADYYTEGRIYAERLSELYHRLYGTSTAAMRFFSVYGMHEEAKKEYANLVTQFLWLMQKDKKPVIYGDGTQRRDFVFVDDVVEALRLAAKVKGFEVLNVGTGRNYSLNETVDMLNSMLGKRIEPEYVNMDVKNYVMETKADVSKAERLIGFRARVTLEEGIRRLIESRG